MTPLALSKLSIGNSDFVKLREAGQIYVDRTGLIYQMATDARRKFFFARPEGFGKTLLVSTFEDLFKNGLKNFKGLEIDKKQWPQSECKVIRLDFSKIQDFENFDQFKSLLLDFLKDSFAPIGAEDTEATEDISSVVAHSLSSVPSASVVVLIDAYDAPLQKCLDKPELFEDVREELQKFYSALEKSDQAVKFLFITGVLQFGYSSPLASLKGLADLTHDDHYKYLLGFSLEDLKKLYGPYVMRADILLRDGYSSSCFTWMESKFGRYCFCNTMSTPLMVPSECLLFLHEPSRHCEFVQYRTVGQAQWLKAALGMDFLKHPENYLLSGRYDFSQLSACGQPPTLNRFVFLLQSGYLTLKTRIWSSPKPELQLLPVTPTELAFPNEEFERWLAQLFLEALVDKNPLTEDKAKELQASLKKEDYKSFVAMLNTILNKVQYAKDCRIDETVLVATLFLILQAAHVQVDLHKAEDSDFRALEIGVDSDRWLIGIQMDDGKATTPSKEATNLRSMKFYGRAVKNIKGLLVFNEKDKRLERWKTIDWKFTNPRSFLGMLHNPSEIGPRVFPDYAEYFNLRNRKMDFPEPPPLDE